MSYTDEKVTKADLAFIDAAIHMLRASQAPKAKGASIDINAISADAEAVAMVGEVVAYVVEAVYHFVNSSLIGEDNALLERARSSKISASVSLDKLVAARDVLAKQLGE